MKKRFAGRRSNAKGDLRRKKGMGPEEEGHGVACPYCAFHSTSIAARRPVGKDNPAQKFCRISRMLPGIAACAGAAVQNPQPFFQFCGVPARTAPGAAAAPPPRPQVHHPFCFCTVYFLFFAKNDKIKKAPILAGLFNRTFPLRKNGSEIKLSITNPAEKQRSAVKPRPLLFGWLQGPG